MLAVVLNSNHFPHFSSWKNKLWMTLSQTNRCEWKLCLNHIHSILGKRTLLTIYCYLIPCPCFSMNLKMTVYHCSNQYSISGKSAFSNRRVCIDHQCAFFGSYNYVSESDVGWYLGESGHPLSLLNEIRRICAFCEVIIIIHPVFSDLTSTTPFNTTRIIYLLHRFWNYLSSMICTFTTQQISLFGYYNPCW